MYAVEHYQSIDRDLPWMKLGENKQIFRICLYYNSLKKYISEGDKP